MNNIKRHQIEQIANMLSMVYPHEISRSLIKHHITEMLANHNIRESKEEQARLIEKIWYYIKKSRKIK